MSKQLQAWTKLDPSRTKTERQRFMREMKRRLRVLNKKVRWFLTTEDELGLGERKSGDLRTLNYRRYAFLTTPQKMRMFQSWLEQQVNTGLLEVEGLSGQAWTAKYVTSAWRKGMYRSYTDVRKEKLETAPGWYRGSKEQWLRSTFLQPEMMSKVELLATRSFEEMKGLSSTMSSQMSRILADGMANGYGPAKIARGIDRQVFRGVNRARAMTIARTEIIHAHAEGQLDGLEALGVKSVQADPEWVVEGKVAWSTARDVLVCEKCRPLEGTVFTIKKARGLIPLHPNCRCAWKPA